MLYLALAAVGLMTPAMRIASVYWWRRRAQRQEIQLTDEMQYLLRRRIVSAAPWAIGFVIGPLLLANNHQVAGPVTFLGGVFLSIAMLAWLPRARRGQRH